MTRPLRVEYAGAFYHVLNRGNGGEKVLAQNRGKEKFLQYVGKPQGSIASVSIPIV